MVVSLRRTRNFAPTQHTRARTLASDQLDVMAEEGAASADIEHRKDSLLHGPEEFRESRSDQNHTKPRFRKSAEQRLSDAAEGMAAYREMEAAKHANMQRLRSERLSRERPAAPTDQTSKRNKPKAGP